MFETSAQNSLQVAEFSSTNRNFSHNPLTCLSTTNLYTLCFCIHVCLLIKVCFRQIFSWSFMVGCCHQVKLVSKRYTVLYLVIALIAGRLLRLPGFCIENNNLPSDTHQLCTKRQENCVDWVGKETIHILKHA